MNHYQKNKSRRYPFKRQLNRKLRKIAFMVVAAAIAAGSNYYYRQVNKPPAETVTRTNQQRLDKQATSAEASLQSSQQTSPQTLQKIRAAKNNTRARFWLTVNGKVIKLLKDDNRGSRHQKFLIKLAPDITLLVAHNIDLVQRIPLKKGDQISLRGRYEWNNRGGMMHWTHHDPRGKKQGGWIKLRSKEYR